MNKRMRPIFRLLICFAVLTAMASSISCQPAKKCLAEAPKPDSRLFNYRQVKLDNGLEVITLEDFSCPIVTLQVWYKVGSKDEQPDRQGYAHLFEHMMFKGTDYVGPKDHFQYVTRKGGTLNAYTNSDNTVYFETLPADQLELALWLEAERMNFLRIDQEAFDTERQVVEEELRMSENRPYGTLHKKMMANLYEVHPYRWTTIGNIAHLRATSVQDLRNFWNKYYLPSNSVIVVAGAVSHNKAQELVRKYFGWLPKYQAPAPVAIREPQQTQTKTVVIDDENAPTGILSIYWHTVPTGHKDQHALELLAEIIGGGNSSRLYRELVAEKQLAVSAGASMDAIHQDGLFSLQAVESQQPQEEPILDIMKKHISNVAETGVTDRELQKAKNQMLKSLVTANLAIDRKARALGYAAAVEGNVENVNTTIDRIKAVTKADIQRVAGDYLSAERSTTFIIKQNTKGMQAGQKDREDVAVTATREEKAPRPGRPGTERPKNYPTRPPVAKKAPAEVPLKYSELTLKNGLKLFIVSNPEVPFVTVQLGITNGAWTETKPGTAAMTLDMLTKGTAKHNEAQLAEELDQYAINLGGSANMDSSSVGGGCLTEQLDRMMALLAEVVFEPTFDKTEFEKLQKQILTDLAIQEESPRYLVERLLRRELYGQHPYSRTTQGQSDDVRALTPQDLRAWWDSNARPEDAVLIMAGDIEKPQALTLVEKHFGSWTSKGPAAKPQLPPVPPIRQTCIYLLDKPGSKQSEIRVAQHSFTRQDQQKFFLSRVVNEYFGGSFHSRLNDVIRVQKGLTYGARGGYNSGRFAGSFQAGTFTKNASTSLTVQVILDEIKKLQSEQPSTLELEDSRGSIIGSFVRQRETPQQIAGDLWTLESNNLPHNFYDKLLRQVKISSQRDCIDLAKNTLDTSRMVIAVVGDASQLKEDLEKIAPVKVISAQQDSQAPAKSD